MSRPSTETAPEKMLAKPKIEWRIVDFPAPFGLMRHNDWRFATWRPGSCMTSILPWPAFNPSGGGGGESALRRAENCQ